jgi:hypothetical protein
MLLLGTVHSKLRCQPQCLCTHAVHAALAPCPSQTRKLSELVAAYCREVLKSTAPHLINRLKVIPVCSWRDQNLYQKVRPCMGSNWLAVTALSDAIMAGKFKRGAAMP